MDKGEREGRKLGKNKRVRGKGRETTMRRVVWEERTENTKEEDG